MSQSKEWFVWTKGLLLGVAAVGISFIASSYYMALNKHDGEPDLAKASNNIDQVEAKRQYGKYCAPCHGLKGDGVTAPPLTKTDVAVEKISQIILKGKGAMPAFSKDIPPGAATAIATYAKTL